MKVGDIGAAFGADVEIVGASGSSWIILVRDTKRCTKEGLEKLTSYANSGIAYMLDKALVSIKPDRLKVGDHVKANYSGSQGFTGVVTGFEMSGGVVCRSLTCKDRVRYAYLPTELEKCVAVYDLQVNHKYRDPNSGKLYRVVDLPVTKMYLLLDDATGVAVCYVTPRVDSTKLVEFGIKDLQDISGGKYRG